MNARLSLLRTAGALRALGVLLVVAALAVVWAGSAFERAPRVLVFSKTAGYRHASIEAGVAAVERLGAEHGFDVEATEDAGMFNEGDLGRFHAVVFLNTTGDVLDAAQQNAFERYIQAGGGWVGVHAATDTEYDWPWYGRLAGAYFTSHPNNPNVRMATFHVADADHPATEGLPASFERADEFYNFRDINRETNVLVRIDESTYEGGSNGADHPMSWYHAYDGGRAFYTAMGHTEESYAEPLFLDHLLGGLQYAIGDAADVDFGEARTPRRPESNRFSKVTLATGLVEPIELAVLPDERVLFIERRGAVKLYHPTTGETETIATIPVETEYTDGGRAEDGLLGLAADPGFADNGWIYLYYSPVGDDPKNVLARYTLRGDVLDMDSRRLVLEVPVQRDECCHTGGSIAFDGAGNLFLSTGDNTNPFDSDGYAPIDERDGRSPWDAQKSSANTNDLRGKILRITPQPDGSYTIPDGNLFTPGTPATRPEIYTMGHRNPYRIAVDARTGFLYWGDVGPDASEPAADRGPAGHDEFNQARGPGNYGWPYFVGDNKRYHDYDFETEASGPLFDPAAPQNLSPNNTGRRALPPARGAYVWYPAAASPEFPILGTGGRSAMAGPVYYRDDFADAARPFPAYYDGKLFIYEWMRGWIIAVTMDEAGDLVSLERFMPEADFSNPIDMAFGPNGDLYVLEYGPQWFAGSPETRLVRIEYTEGNRRPVAEAHVDRTAGALPLRVALSSEGSMDYDGDALTFAWTIADADGDVVARLDGAEASHTLAAPGVYRATLTVTDPDGLSATSETTIAAGNEPPEVTIELTAGNRSFFLPGTPVDYVVRVVDAEDGSLEDGRIAAAEVAMSATFMEEGFDRIEVEQGHIAADAVAAHAVARRLIGEGTCLSCHRLDAESIGPSYLAVAERYDDGAESVRYIAGKIREGGAGVWGEVMMPPHPQLSEPDVERIARYILSLDDAPSAGPAMATEGRYVPDADARGGGAVVLRAAYTDRGAEGVPPAAGEEVLVLRSPSVGVHTADVLEGMQVFSVPEPPMNIAIVGGDGAYFALEDVDLTGIDVLSMTLLAPKAMLNAAGGHLEVRTGGPDGRLLGTSARVEPTEGPPGPPTTVALPIEPTDGVHDLYVVARGEGAPGQPLFALIALHFGTDDAWSSADAAPGGSPGGAGLSTSSTVGELLAHDGARAVLERHLPGFTTDPRLDQAMGMSLVQIAPFAPDTMTDAVLAAIAEDLAEL